MNLRTIILLYVLTTITGGFDIKKKLKGRSEKLKKKINSLMNNKKGDELFLDINDFEYPGTNETLRKIHREQWLEYYECLKEAYARNGPKKSIFPAAIMAFEGTAVELECDVCTSPAEMHILELVEWYFNSSSNNSIANESVELTEHTLISPEYKSLLMFNIQPYQSGQYWCKLGNTLAAPYFVHVDNGSEPTQMVHPNEAPQAIHALPTAIIARYNLKVYSSWTEWTECSTCDKVGKKVRYGYCTISLLDSSFHESFFDGNKTEIKSSSRSQLVKRDAEQEVGEMDEDLKATSAMIKTILPIFKNKMPCRSAQTPKVIQDIEEIKNRKTEIMIKCQKNVIFEVRDKAGNVLESANNSAGIYSMLQGLPDASPTVTRITFYQKHGTKTILKCPGNLNTDTPVIWQIANQVVNPMLLAEQSEGRIYIDLKNQLVIIKLRFADGNIYSCWQDGELAGTIRLEVTHEVEIKFDHRVFMIGAIIIISVFLYVFWKAFQGRKRITKH